MVLALFLLSSQVFAIQSTLLKAEEKIYQSLPVVAEKLSSLEKNLQDLPQEKQLHWFMLKAKVIVHQSDYKGLVALITRARKLLNSKTPYRSYWIKLFQLNRLIIRQNGQTLLHELSKLEQGIEASENAQLIAYFHRLRYQAYDIQEIWDFSLDNAVVNHREWENLAEPFFALEAKIAIVRLSANMNDFNGAYKTLRKAQISANQLYLNNVLIELEVLEAKLALHQKKPDRAVAILKALITDKSIGPEHDLYALVHHKLALVHLKLRNFDEVIELIDELFSSGKIKDAGIRVSLDLLLAKSLVEKKTIYSGAINRAAGRKNI